jgi:hypothetical protein
MVKRISDIRKTAKGAIERIKTLDGYNALRGELNAVLTKSGFNGGCVIFHAFRIIKNKKDL